MKNLIERARKRLTGVGLMAVSVLALASAGVGTAHAVGTPVWDPAAITQIVKGVAQDAQQLIQLKESVTQVTKMTDTIGKIGPGFAGAIMKDVGVNFHQQANPLKSLEGSMPRLIDSLPKSQAGRALGLTASMANNSKTSIEAGRQFVNQAFYAKTSNAAALIQRNQVREAAVRDAASLGYAMSVVQKNEALEMATTMKGLSEKVGSSTDMRSDMAANTAVLMASLQAQANTNAMLAQLVHLEAAQAIANDRK